MNWIARIVAGYFGLLLVALGLPLPVLWVKVYGSVPVVFWWTVAPVFIVVIPVVSVVMAYFMVFKPEELFGG